MLKKLKCKKHRTVSTLGYLPEDEGITQRRKRLVYFRISANIMDIITLFQFVKLWD